MSHNNDYVKFAVLRKEALNFLSAIEHLMLAEQMRQHTATPTQPCSSVGVPLNPVSNPERGWGDGRNSHWLLRMRPMGWKVLVTLLLVCPLTSPPAHAESISLNHKFGQHCDATDDCARGLFCFETCPEDLENCFHVETNTCVTHDYLHCSTGGSCSKYGNCTWRKGVCMATRATDCQRSSQCREQGA